MHYIGLQINLFRQYINQTFFLQFQNNILKQSFVCSRFVVVKKLCGWYKAYKTKFTRTRIIFQTVNLQCSDWRWYALSIFYSKSNNYFFKHFYSSLFPAGMICIWRSCCIYKFDYQMLKGRLQENMWVFLGCVKQRMWS